MAKSYFKEINNIETKKRIKKEIEQSKQDKTE